MPTYLTGNDGGVALGTNHGAQFNVWNASFSRNVSDISGFGDGARRRRLGVHDVSGSAGGYLVADSKGPGANTTDWASDGATIYLHARGSGTSTGSTSANTNCTLSFVAVVSDIAISNAKTGDAAVSFNFQLSGGSAPTETWDET
jgi:hypothetical protein